MEEQKSEVKKKKKRFNLWWWIALIIIIIVGFWLLFKLQDYRGSSVLNAPVVIDDTICRADKLAQDAPEGWIEFSDEQACVSFVYPDHWEQPQVSKAFGYITDENALGRQFSYDALSGTWKDINDPSFNPIKERSGDVDVWNLGYGEGGCSIAHLHIDNREKIVSVSSSTACSVDRDPNAATTLDQQRIDLEDFAFSVIAL